MLTRLRAIRVRLVDALLHTWAVAKLFWGNQIFAYEVPRSLCDQCETKHHSSLTVRDYPILVCIWCMWANVFGGY